MPLGLWIVRLAQEAKGPVEATLAALAATRSEKA